MGETAQAGAHCFGTATSRMLDMVAEVTMSAADSWSWTKPCREETTFSGFKALAVFRVVGKVRSQDSCTIADNRLRPY